MQSYMIAIAIIVGVAASTLAVPERDTNRLAVQSQDARRPNAAPASPSAADQLLKELRSRRPSSPLIAPVGASGLSKKEAPQLLLPEGATVVQRTGHLGHDGMWHTLTSELADGELPIRLLPNARLDVMVKTARGSAGVTRFVVSGEATVFENRNYLLVRFVSREEAASAAPKPKQAAPSPGTHHDATAGSVSATDVLRAMQDENPDADVLAMQPYDTGSAPRAGSLAARSQMPDGTPLIRRPGRLVQDGAWWSFVFESDQPAAPEPPMKVLPNKNAELMVNATKQGSMGLIFLVSGEITLFEGENYLLPRAATRRVDTGNFRK